LIADDERRCIAEHAAMQRVRDRYLILFGPKDQGRSQGRCQSDGTQCMIDSRHAVISPSKESSAELPQRDQALALCDQDGGSDADLDSRCQYELLA
jgi:hypothetical protein